MQSSWAQSLIFIKVAGNLGTQTRDLCGFMKARAISNTIPHWSPVLLASFFKWYRMELSELFPDYCIPEAQWSASAPPQLCKYGNVPGTSEKYSPLLSPNNTVWSDILFVWMNMMLKATHAWPINNETFCNSLLLGLCFSGFVYTSIVTVAQLQHFGVDTIYTYERVSPFGTSNPPPTEIVGRSTEEFFSCLHRGVGWFTYIAQGYGFFIPLTLSDLAE